MPAVITGAAGGITIAGSAVNGKVTRWSLRVSTVSVETSGAGDTYVTRTALRYDYEVTGEFYAYDQADWDLDQALAGTIAAVTLFRKSSDTNPYFSGTGLISEFEVDHPADGPTTARFTLISQSGDAPTLDPTPAT